MASSLRCLLIADFNTANFAGLLENDGEEPRIEPMEVPFGQVVPLLADGSHACWRERPELAIVWTQPHAMLPSVQALMEASSVDAPGLEAEVDAFADLIRGAAARVRWLFLVSWGQDPAARLSGMTDWQPGRGLAHTLSRANLRLAGRLEAAGNVVLLDGPRWLAAAGVGACDPRLWYQGKIPFSHPVFQEAVGDVKAALRGLHGQARKLIALDLDETLWGGVVGDVGWEGLKLGGHDPIGEAYLDFQRALKSLTRRGVLLGIVSKNDEAVALQAIRRHPEMQLSLDDFAGWRIRWEDKAGALVELAGELNLGLESVVFIDDNPAERSRVQQALPEVLVPEWPVNPMLFRRALLSLRCFDRPAVTEEDRGRTRSYVSERQRNEAKRQVISVQEWLESLQTVVTVEALSRSNLPRAAQLMNKTNQMNLSTRRLSEAELEAWSSRPGHSVWTFRVSDRFGDSGLTGLASLSVDGPRARVVDFVLSCRVMGRKVEECMVHWLVTCSTQAGADSLWAEVVPTPKNGPCREFWKRSGLGSDDGLHFRWEGARDYALPGSITLHRSS